MKLQTLVDQTPNLLALFFASQIYYWHHTYDNTLPRLLAVGTFLWFFFVILFKVIDFHKRWGFFGVSEPDSHFWFSLKNTWVVQQWILGVYWYSCMLGLVPHQPHHANPDEPTSLMTWQFPEGYRYTTDSKIEQFIYGLICLYVIDFLRYWVHRIGHMQFFYRTFPFSHAHHHNQTFLNPWALATSPFFHFAYWSSITPMILLWGVGLRQSAIWASILIQVPNFNQHLGCDPFPWLTRWNHYYFKGALPWVPLYHQYHHIPWVKRGNFGNLTSVWDYYYGTLIPESIEHIETGKPPKHVQEKFENPKLNEDFEVKLKNKNILDLNPKYDASIFSLRYL